MQRENKQEDPGKCPGAVTHAAGYKFKCFHSGRAASTNFGCHKVSFLQVLFANNEVANR